MASMLSYIAGGCQRFALRRVMGWRPIARLNRPELQSRFEYQHIAPSRIRDCLSARQNGSGRVLRGGIWQRAGAKNERKNSQQSCAPVSCCSSGSQCKPLSRSPELEALEIGPPILVGWLGERSLAVFYQRHRTTGHGLQFVQLRR